MLDASRAVPGDDQPEGRPTFVMHHRAEYVAIRKVHSSPRQTVVSLETTANGGLRSSGVPRTCPSPSLLVRACWATFLSQRSRIH